jgi:hypothetical protein
MRAGLKRLAIASVLIGALVLLQSASAALVVRMAVSPAHPRAGERVTLVLRTYVPFKAEGRPCDLRLQPWRLRYPFRVEAVSPKDEIIRVHVRQGKSNRYIGRFRPGVAGTWTIRVTNFGPRYNRCSGGLLRFRVRR